MLELKETAPLRLLEEALNAQSIGAQPLERMNWQIARPTKCRAIVVGLGNVDTLSIPATVRRLEKALKAALNGA